MNNDQPTNENQTTYKSFLQEEIKNTRDRLHFLQGKLNPDDFKALEAQLNEISQTLDSLTDKDENQLFLLRREIGILREDMESMAVKQGWWARLPLAAKAAVLTVPVIVYLIWMSVLQLSNPGKIYDYPATQTAVASQATLSSATVMPTSTPKLLP